MNRRFLRFFAALLTIATLFTNANIAFAQQEELYRTKTYCVDAVENPVYYGETAGEPISVDFEVSPQTAATYHSGEIDESLYTTSMETAAQSVRDSMELRTAKFTLHYKCTTPELTATDLDTLITSLFEKTFEETESPTEGDYLRYAWTSLWYGDEEANSIAVSYIPNGNSRDYYVDIVYNFTYYTTLGQEQELTEEVEDAIDGFGFDSSTTDRQKVDKIYNYITTNIRYDYANLEDESYTLKFTAYAALMHKTAVCEGYAVLFYRMAEMCGIDSRVITGWGDTEPHPSDESDQPDHAWNIAKLGSYYYYLDSTWDESVTAGTAPKTAYYLKGSTDFLHHTNEQKFNSEAFLSRYPIAEYQIGQSTFSGTVTEGDFTYYIEDGIASLIKYTGTAADVTVPGQTLGGYPVRAIDYEAFHEVDTMQTLTISEGITTLWWNSIYLCRQLTAIHLPSTLKIEYEQLGDALSGATQLPNFCYNLSTITVAAGNPYIKVVDGVLYTADMKALLLCPAQKEAATFTIPEGVETIANHAFADCVNIEKVVMPDTVNYLGYWSFARAEGLKEINISTACEFIGQFFVSNTKVSKLHIPKSVTCIMGGAFGNIVFESLTAEAGGTYYMENGALRTENEIFRVITDAKEFTVPAGIERINIYAFSNLKNLEKVTLPDTLIDLAGYAFEDCVNLTHVTIPAGTQQIGSYAFIGCEKLASVLIPSSVTQLGEPGESATETFRMLGWPNENFTLYCQEGSYIYNLAIEAQLSARIKAIEDFICADGHELEQIYDAEYLQYTFTCKNCGDRAQTITPYNIQNAEAEIEFFNTEYTGQEIKPKILGLTFSGKQLIEGVDYVIMGYENNVEIGSAAVIIRGIGAWGGIKKVGFSITEIHIDNIEFTLEYHSIPYDGTVKKPTVVAEGFIEGVDFTVEYADIGIPGEIPVRINGIGKCWGSKTLYFTITPRDISDMECSLPYESVEYTPAGHDPFIQLEGLNYFDDYRISYENNVNVGTATVIITGVGYYTGTITKTFEITEADISDFEAYILDDIRPYNGTAYEPEVYWMTGSATLGTDYTVTYTNNVQRGTATLTIQGIGNYKGSITIPFEITEANLENWSGNLMVGACNLCGSSPCVYSGKQHKPSVSIPGLTQDVDFSVSYGPNVHSGQGWIQVTGIGNYGGSFSQTINIAQLHVANLPIQLEYTQATFTGDALLPKVSIEGLEEYNDYTVTYNGDVVSVGEAQVEIVGFGDYCGSVTKTYKINPADISARKNSTTLSYAQVAYSGKKHEPAVTINGLTKGVDFNVAYKNNVNAGTATVTIQGIGNYKGSFTKTFTIKKASQAAPAKPTLSAKTTTTVTLKAISGYEYSKNGTTWQASNKFTGLKANTAYKFYQRKKATANQLASAASAALSVKTICAHKYSNSCDASCNLCKATRTIKHNYSKYTTVKATASKNGYVLKECVVCGKDHSKTTIYYAKTFKLSATSYTYNGKAKTPAVSVKDSKGNTISSKYYTVTYASGRKNVGKYKVTITMKGNYSGTKTLYLTINPPKTTLKKLAAGKKSIKVYVNKKASQVTGYQIQYSTSKKFTSAKTKTIAKYSTTTATLSKLTAKKTYYVRVRTYKTVGGVKYYSGWSTHKYTKAK